MDEGHLTIEDVAEDYVHCTMCGACELRCPNTLFTGDFYRVLLAEPALPGRLAHIAPFMAADDWLGAYGDFDTLEQVFRGIARRLSRPEGMDGVMGELEVLYEPLLADFREFYPQLQAFALASR